MKGDLFHCFQLRGAPLKFLPSAWRVHLHTIINPQVMAEPLARFPQLNAQLLSSPPSTTESSTSSGYIALEKFQLAPVEIPVLVINSLLDGATKG